MSDGWLSNTYIVGDEMGGSAVMVDAGGPVAPLLEFLNRGQLTLTQVLLTHHHHDHVAELDTVKSAFPDVPVLIHPLERDQVPGATDVMQPGQTIEIGALRIETIHTPGHTAGMLSLLFDGTDVFTGDTLFKGSVGGVRAPGHTTYADLKTSIMDKLLALPAATRIHPGHTDPTTVADELETQPVRADLAWSRCGGHRAVHCDGRARHPHPARRRLRRRAQGMGPLARRLR